MSKGRLLAIALVVIVPPLVVAGLYVWRQGAPPPPPPDPVTPTAQQVVEVRLHRLTDTKARVTLGDAELGEVALSPEGKFSGMAISGAMSRAPLMTKRRIEIVLDAGLDPQLGHGLAKVFGMPGNLNVHVIVNAD